MAKKEKKVEFTAMPKEPLRTKKVMLRLTPEEYSKLVRKCIEDNHELAWSIRKVLREADYI